MRSSPAIGASATFAVEFGWTRGATEVYRWTYAFAGVALDLLKSSLPILGAMTWHERKPALSSACWLVFAVLTTLSLWCAYGSVAWRLSWVVWATAWLANFSASCVAGPKTGPTSGH